MLSSCSSTSQAACGCHGDCWSCHRRNAQSAGIVSTIADSALSNAFWSFFLFLRLTSACVTFQGAISTTESISTNISHSATQMTSSGNSSEAATHLQTSSVRRRLRAAIPHLRHRLTALPLPAVLRYRSIQRGPVLRPAAPEPGQSQPNRRLVFWGLRWVSSLWCRLLSV